MTSSPYWSFRLHHRERQDRAGVASSTVLGRADVAGSERFGQLQSRVGEMLARASDSGISPAPPTSIARCREVDDGFGLDALSTCMRRASICSNKIPRLPTGMAFSFLRPNSRPDNRTTRSSALTGESLKKTHRLLSVYCQLVACRGYFRYYSRAGGYHVLFSCWRGTTTHVGGFQAKATRNPGNRGCRAMGAARLCRYARWGVDTGLSEQSDAQCAARFGARDR